MRNLDADYKTALAADLLRVGLIVEIDYPATPLRAWTGQGELVWDSKTWLGVGDLGGISAVRETGSPQATNVTLEISGITSTNLALALAETSQRRRATVWLALFEETVVDDAPVLTLIGAPWRVRRGWTDVHKIIDTGKTASIQVTVESLFARLRIARTMRYTDHDQQRLFPGDTGMRYAPSIGTRPIYWGTAAPSGFPSAPGGGGTGETRSDAL